MSVANTTKLDEYEIYKAPSVDNKHNQQRIGSQKYCCHFSLQKLKKRTMNKYQVKLTFNTECYPTTGLTATIKANNIVEAIEKSIKYCEVNKEHIIKIAIIDEHFQDVYPEIET